MVVPSIYSNVGVGGDSIAVDLEKWARSLTGLPIPMLNIVTREVYSRANNDTDCAVVGSSSAFGATVQGAGNF